MNIRALFASLSGLFLYASAFANVPDSSYVFTYNNGMKRGQEGLMFAWSADGQRWTPMTGFAPVTSDYGAWGIQKRMLSPDVTLLPDGSFAACWALNENCDQIAVATSRNLVDWMPQEYPYLTAAGNCLEPRGSFANGLYTVVFHNSRGEYFSSSSSDFYHFSEPVRCSADKAHVAAKATIDGKEYEGSIIKLPRARVDEIINRWHLKEFWTARHNETAAGNAARFAGMKDVDVDVDINLNDRMAISNELIGIFFEDINYAADGGLYAELLENRDFEYDESEVGRERGWSHSSHWEIDGGRIEICTESPIHENNPHYARINSTSGASLTNTGYQGVPVRKGEKYDFSFYSRVPAGQKAIRLEAAIVAPDGRVLASKSFNVGSKTWKKQAAVLTASASEDKAVMRLSMPAGNVDIDFVSLFPQNTFKGRKNGLRADLAQVLVDMNPRFMRFPGGCVSHGQGLDNIYRWKETVGPLISRKPAYNIWRYHQSRGLGFYEFFQFCEDAGMEPLPVLAAGVPCQNSERGGAGQQGGIPLEEMDEYIQDILDLVEWANGDPRKNKWAKMRADAGHPEPFNMKYLGIGNEDLISKVFEERYLMIVDAVREKYPEITVIGTVGPFWEGSDYERGWEIAKEHKIEMVDEHYYQSTGWYVHHQDFYDNYDRNASKVYLGEYAAHNSARNNTIETALSAAMHICNLERNGDIVAMSSYAPLLSKKGFSQWSPDLIYFDNTSIELSTDYWAQQMCGTSAGDSYVATTLSINDKTDGLRQRLAASTVLDSRTGKLYIKLVNLSGVPASTKLSIAGLDGTRDASTRSLCGDWNQTDAAPKSGSLKLGPETIVKLAPYEFLVIEAPMAR